MTLDADLLAADRLERAADCILAGRVVPPEDGPLVALTLRRCAATAKPRVRDGIALRNELICEAAERFYPGLRVDARAKALARDLARYAGSAWRFDRTLPACSERHRGRVEEYCWRILKAHPRVLSGRHIRRILGQN